MTKNVLGACIFVAVIKLLRLFYLSKIVNSIVEWTYRHRIVRIDFTFSNGKIFIFMKFFRLLQTTKRRTFRVLNLHFFLFLSLTLQRRSQAKTIERKIERCGPSNRFSRFEERPFFFFFFPRWFSNSGLIVLAYMRTKIVNGDSFFIENRRRLDCQMITNSSSRGFSLLFSYTRNNDKFQNRFEIIE